MIAVPLVDLVLPNTVESIAVAREAASRVSKRHVTAEAAEIVRLLTSELMANCVRHGRGAIGLVIDTDSDNLRVAVSDEGAAEVGIKPFGPDPGGHGIRLVEELSDGWEQVTVDPTCIRFSVTTKP